LFYVGLGYFTGFRVFYFVYPALAYTVIPLMDWVIGRYMLNPSTETIAQIERDPYYRALVQAFVPGQFVLTLFGAWIIGTDDSLPWWGALGLVLSVGAVSGVAFIADHELMHRRSSLDRWLSKLTMAPTCYGHFFTEHVRGHHKNVATPGDPTSAAMGETYWRYLVRAMVTGVVSAWRIERARLARRNIPVWSPRNEVLQVWSMTAVLFGALALWLGFKVVPFLFAQALFGTMLLEVSNYIQHYGLLRKRLPSGKYEPVSPAHTWDSNYVFCSLFMYHIQRHADHHTNPGKRYQILCAHPETPQLPGSYVSMYVLAFIPPIWFRVMDPKVAAYYDGDLSRAHVYRSRRPVLARSH
jgi:alkane 1-monooxygenase